MNQSVDPLYRNATTLVEMGPSGAYTQRLGSHYFRVSGEDSGLITIRGPRVIGSHLEIVRFKTTITPNDEENDTRFEKEGIRRYEASRIVDMLGLGHHLREKLPAKSGEVDHYGVRDLRALPDKVGYSFGFKSGANRDLDLLLRQLQGHAGEYDGRKVVFSRGARNLGVGSNTIEVALDFAALDLIRKFK